MKKRLFAGLICLILAMTCMLVFAACDDGDDSSAPLACTHGQMTWIEEVPASCAETGTVGHYHCSECGKNFDANKAEISDLTIPFAHNPGTEWLTENDKHYHACLNGCAAKIDETYCFGPMHYSDEGHWGTCSVCDEDTAIVKHDHTAKVVVNLASCTEGGYTTYSCVCGHSYIDGETNAKDHTYSEAWEKDDSHHWHPADCGCKDARWKYEKHSYDAVVTAPGCETQGYTTYTCKCGDSYVSDYVAATGHKVDEWIEFSSTIFDAGKCEYSVSYRGMCANCKTEQTKTEQVERHSFFERVTTSATCKEQGTKSTFCASESCKYHNNAYKKENYRDSNAHIWVEDTKASNPEKGITVYCCDEKTCTATKRVATGNTAGVSKEEIGNMSEIELPDATIGIDQGIQQTIGKTDVSISAGVLEGTAKDEVIDRANLDDEQKKLLGDGKIYNFTITTDTDEEISILGGTATIRIRYDLQKDDDPNHIIVWYVSEGNLEAVEAVYSEDANGDGYVTFQTKHFSYYTVTKLAPHLLCEKLNKHSDKHLFVIEPTCVTDGYTVCLRCGKEVEGTRVKAHGHTMSTTSISETSCSQHGVLRHSCADCGLTYDSVTPAFGHYYILSAQITATCKNHGSLTYTCVHCDASYTQTTPKLAHVYHTTLVEPTCETVGYTEKTCTRCGEVANTLYTPATGHTEGEAWLQNEKGHYHLCTVCGEQMSEGAHLPGPEATEHSAQICTICEYMLVAPIVHTHQLTKVDAQEATCTIGGKIEYYTCTCGAWFGDADAQMPIPDHTSVLIDAKGHTPENKAAVEPTCDEDGYTAGVWCSGCQSFIRGHIRVSKYGHDYHKTMVVPTCTQKGSEKYVCAHCNHVDESRSREIEALGHNIVSIVQAPTCTEGGYVTHSCTRCEYLETVNTDAALEHKYATAYQMNEDGHWHLCMRCDHATKQEAHTPDYKEATTEHGIKCVHCDYVIAEILAHTHDRPQSIAASNATCTVAGNIAYYICSCGDWFYDAACTQPIYDRASVIVKPAGHTLTYHATRQPTCTEVGYTSGAYCEVCKIWFTGHEEIAMVDHIYAKMFQYDTNGHWHQCLNCDATAKSEEHKCDATVTAPTCCEKGYTTYTCSDCGYSYTADETATVVHQYERGRCKWCGEAEPVDPSKPIVLYKLEETSNDGSKMVYLFYSNGEVVATYMDKTMTAYWLQKDGLVFLYEDAAHTKFIGKAKINGDGTVTPYVCTEHNYVLVEKVEASCEQGAYEAYECTECGQGYGNGSGPLGHEFGTDGLCTRCGKPDDGSGGGTIKPDDPNTPNQPGEENPCVKYEYEKEYLGEDGILYCELYKFLTDGTVDVKISVNGKETITGTVYWNFDGRFVRTYVNADHTERIGTYTIGEDGKTLNAWKCREHVYEVLEHKDATCTESGHSYSECIYCGAGSDSVTLPLGHEYDKDGNCIRCDERENGSMPDVDPELKKYKKDVLSMMQKEWLEAVPNAAVQEAYRTQFQMLCSMVENAESVFDIKSIYEDNFKKMIDKISGRQEEVRIDSIECAKNDLRVEQGYRVEQFLESQLINSILYVYCSDNSIERIEITRDMIDTMEQDFSVSGTVIFYVRYAGHSAEIKITVVAPNCRHKNVTTETGKPSCVSAGYERVICNDCGVQISYKTIEMIPHNYVDGICQWCGVLEDNTLEQTRKKILAAMKAEWDSLLETGTSITEAQQNAFAVLLDSVASATSERLIQNLFQKDFKELLSLVHSGTDPEFPEEGCQHSDLITEAVPPTCTEAGYTKTICTYCGAQQSYVEIFAYGHDYVNGKCTHCGESEGAIDEELEKIKTEVFASMTTEFHKLAEKYEITDEYWSRLESIFAKVQASTDSKSVLSLYETTFKKLIDEIVSKCIQKPQEPEPERELIYELDYVGVGETAPINCKFYSGGVLVMSGDGMTQTMYWIERDSVIFIYADELFNELVAKALVDENGSVTPLTCETHDYAMIGHADSTCTMAGYSEYQCVVCAHRYTESSLLLLHEYGEDGNCIRCGRNLNDEPEPKPEEPDINPEEIKNQILNMMKHDWEKICDGYDVWSKYHNTYKRLHGLILSATTEDEAWELYQKNFTELLREIEKNCEKLGGDNGGGEDFENVVVDVQFCFDTYHEVRLGTDVEGFLQKNLVGAPLVIYYSDGTTKTVYLSRDAIDANGVSFDRIGYTEIEIHYSIENGGVYQLYVQIEVQADFSNAKELGTYMFKQADGSLTFTLYDNGYAKVTMTSGDYSDSITMAYTLHENLLYVDMDGVTMILELSANGTADMYQPTGDKMATYTYKGVTMDVYGTYTEAGEYFAVLYDETQRLTTPIYLDLTAGEIKIAMFSKGMLKIAEDGSLYCDHDYETLYENAANCWQDGYIETVCVHCSASNGTVLPALGHSYDENGYCKNCGLKDGDGDGKVDVPSFVIPDNGSGNDYVYGDITINGGAIVGGGDYTYTDKVVNGNVIITPNVRENYAFVYDVNTVA